LYIHASITDDTSFSGLQAFLREQVSLQVCDEQERDGNGDGDNVSIYDAVSLSGQERE
jgi:hypothetical protein